MKKLTEKGFSIAKKKCELLKQSVEWLGFKLDKV